MKFAKYILPIGLVVSTLGFAGGVELPPQPVSSWYGIIGGGYAWSDKTNMQVNLSFWDPANEGYNGTLAQSPFVTLGVGKRISSCLLADISANYFGNFQYRRFQTSGSASTPGFTGNSRERSFDLTNYNLMFNLTLNSERFSYPIGNMSITPFIGGGIGVAVNTVKNFYTITSSGQTTSSNNSSINTVTLALQAQAGLSFNLTQRSAIDVGYRYYYGGCFNGPSSIFGTGNNAVMNAVPAWKGKVSAQLLFADLRFAI